MVAVSSVKVGVYNLAVPILHVRFKGGKDTTQIAAAQVENNGKALVVKNEAGESIGSINLEDIAGWWIGPALGEGPVAF